MSRANPIFDVIAPFYGMFFGYQKKQFRRLLRAHPDLFGQTPGLRVLDVGCGTGALSSVLAEEGFLLTGIDPAHKMLDAARKKTKGQEITYLAANAVEGLPFPDKSFQISVASFVAHGLSQAERLQMYREMSRVTSSRVLLIDYSQKRYPLVSLVEWLERGDYFQFIQAPAEELEHCEREDGPCFKAVEVREIGKWSACYICPLSP